MIHKKTFLIEIGTEEMPPKSIQNIAQKFYENITLELKKKNIQFSNINIFHSPRRIALQIEKINTYLIIQKKTYKGPSIKNSFNNTGLLTISAYRWLKKFNINIKDTKKLITQKGSWLIYEDNEKKISVKNILPEIIVSSITNISISKTMIWNEHNINFVRPIRNITMMLDNQLISSNIFGIRSNRYIYGNISKIQKKIKLPHAKEYEMLLYQQGKVIANFEKRKKKIYNESTQIAKNIHGKLNISTQLLDEVTCLVEWPTVLHGKFDKEFLVLPIEVLVYIMESIQRYFPIYDINNQLLAHFIIIANIEPKKSNNIILGNQRVLHARLSDAKFFLENDQKCKLQEYFSSLKNIIFHEKLGSMYEKSKRLITLIQYVIQYTKANEKESIRSAYLSKCDLKTQMVYEFPELQGIIGMYYSIYHGESTNIALSLKEQYQPKFSGDVIPSNIVGCSLAITDKIDTIIGLFLIGQYPTHNKDPFGLRRLTIGIIRIIIEKKININLESLIKKSIDTYNMININTNILQKIIQFILNRLYVWYKEQKYDINIVKSVFLLNINNCLDIHKRIQAICTFQNHTSFKNLISIKKRIQNLIKDININIDKNYTISFYIMKDDKEKELFIQTQYIKNILYFLVIKKKYKQSLKILFDLNIFINKFLNTISIKYDDQKLKMNRVALLIQIKKLFFLIADF